MKKASVIVPMYNSEKTIAELLEALENQTEKNFELIIVDDGSTDNSLKIVKRHKSSYTLRIISQKNAGPAAARNKGAYNSKAQILIFLDSDCVPDKKFVEKMIEPFKNPDIAGVQGEYETKNTGSIIARYIGYEMAYRQEPMKNAQKIDHIATHAGAYRKKDFGRGFLETFKKADMEDIELSYRFAKSSKRLVFQTEAKIKHPHPESFIRFIKQQYGRGYWRVFGHAKHPDKLLKDSYLGNSLAVQGGLSVLFFFFLVVYILTLLILKTNFFAYLPLGGLFALFISNLGLGAYCWKKEKKMILIAPLIAVTRSLAATIGFSFGTLVFALKNRFK